MSSLKQRVDLIQIGQGQLAYMRKMLTDELATCFPNLPPMAPGVIVWALFGAGGEPLILSDTRSDLLATAREQSLETVSLH